MGSKAEGALLLFGLSSRDADRGDCRHAPPAQWPYGGAGDLLLPRPVIGQSFFFPALWIRTGLLLVAGGRYSL